MTDQTIKEIEQVLYLEKVELMSSFHELLCERDMLKAQLAAYFKYCEKLSVATKARKAFNVAITEVENAAEELVQSGAQVPQLELIVP